VFTSPNSLVGTLIGGRFLDDSTSPASSGVLKEWSNFFHLRPPLKSDESYSHNDKFISSTAIVKVRFSGAFLAHYVIHCNNQVAFGNRQGFEMDFPAECVFRVTGDTRIKDPTQILHTMYRYKIIKQAYANIKYLQFTRRSLGLEVPKLKNVSYPDAAGFALLADYQWVDDDDDPSRHMYALRVMRRIYPNFCEQASRFLGIFESLSISHHSKCIPATPTLLIATAATTAATTTKTKITRSQVTSYKH
jgi:hypothetical protein